MPARRSRDLRGFTRTGRERLTLLSRLSSREETPAEPRHEGVRASANSGAAESRSVRQAQPVQNDLSGLLASGERFEVLVQLWHSELLP